MGLMAVLGGLLGTCGVVALLALGASQEQPSGVVLGALLGDGRNTTRTRA